MEDIEHYDIPVYNFPYDVEEDDEETIQDNSELRVRAIKPLLANAPVVDPRLRLSCPSPSLAPRRRSRSTVSLFARGSTPGVSPRWTTPSTLTLAG